MTDPFSSEHLHRLIRDVEDLVSTCRQRQAQEAQTLAAMPQESRLSAANLIHYLAIRDRDVIPLQENLCHLGLSSLGRMEAHVSATLGAVRMALLRLAGLPCDPVGEEPLNGFALGGKQLAENAAKILGDPTPDRSTRIMVTMPTEAAQDPVLISALLSAGMEIMRINCAHDDPPTWLRMVENLRKAEALTGKKCKVAFDLAGPKLRTGPIEPGPPVIHWKPVRDWRGEVISPARIRFYPFDATSLPPVEDGLPLPREDFHRIQPGSLLRLRDARGRRRDLNVVATSGDCAIAECDHTGYVEPGTAIEIISGSHHIGTTAILPFVAPPIPIELRAGDQLVLFLGDTPGLGPSPNDEREGATPARIGCDFSGLFTDCQPGDPILFDDGKITGIIVERHPEELLVEIQRTSKNPGRLRPEKGINVPATSLTTPALTTKDLDDLVHVVPHADMVSLSFVRGPRDVADLVRELDRLHAPHVGIVLKIETRAAFENLGDILLESLRHPPVAVMIARGDLGVELGFERMAEVQEEILWLCEAAHVPVIWATQVLETLAKKGLATRAEVTDAAMSSRAEGVMLNKGPHIVQAVRTLSDILTRMHGHQRKKTARLRRLNVATSDKGHPDRKSDGKAG